MVYLLAVLLVSSYSGGWLGLLTSFLSVAALDFRGDAPARPRGDPRDLLPAWDGGLSWSCEPAGRRASPKEAATRAGLTPLGSVAAHAALTCCNRGDSRGAREGSAGA